MPETLITFDAGTIGQPQTDLSGDGVYAAGIHGTGIRLLVGEQASTPAATPVFSMSVYWKQQGAISSSALRVARISNDLDAWSSVVRAHSNQHWQTTQGSTLFEDSGVDWAPDTVYRIDAQWNGTTITWRIYDDTGTLVHAFTPLLPPNTPWRVGLGGGGGPANTDSIVDTLRFSDDVRLWNPYVPASGVRNLHMGSSPAQAVYMGAQPAQKVFHGDTLVWQA